MPAILNKLNKRITHKTWDFINKRRGWKTNRKIIVIESDDWGAIRTPSKVAYGNLLDHGIRVDKCNYCKNDTIADKTDLEDIFQVLNSIRNAHGISPKITANTIVANPDFDRIKSDKFQKYYYETIEQTFKKYPNRSLEYWKQGIDSKVFKPQLHGREHVNVERWLKALPNNSVEMKVAFDNNMYGLSRTISSETSVSYLEALQLSDPNIKKHIDDSVKIFKNLFGFFPKTFIAPNYCWNDEVERALASNGIYGIQGSKIQKINNRSKYHYLGEKNNLGQIYLVRNILFEPALNPDGEIINRTFHQIVNSFKNCSPAIICSHRVNFIGALNENNRTENLKKLKILLLKVIDSYPEVEFMFSDELYNLIESQT